MLTRSIAAGILFSLFATLALAPSTGSGQAYPNRAIRLIIDTSPGGITDILGRLSAEGLAQKLGQAVVVENRPGASGNVAIDFVVRSPADGHTLMIAAGGNLVVKPFLEHALAFDPMNDLAPVFNVAEAPHILVVPASLPVKTLTPGSSSRATLRVGDISSAASATSARMRRGRHESRPLRANGYDPRARRNGRGRLDRRRSAARPSKSSGAGA